MTDHGRTACSSIGIDPGPLAPASLEHQFWVRKATEHFEKKGYTVSHEHVIKNNGAIDLLAERPGQKIAVEVETGKSNIKANLAKVKTAGFDRVVLVATSPVAVTTCQKVIDAADHGAKQPVELYTWLDVS